VVAGAGAVVLGAVGLGSVVEGVGGVVVEAAVVGGGMTSSPGTVVGGC
jgi:hypothetical protein